MIEGNVAAVYREEMFKILNIYGDVYICRRPGQNQRNSVSFLFLSRFGVMFHFQHGVPAAAPCECETEEMCLCPPLTRGGGITFDSGSKLSAFGFNRLLSCVSLRSFSAELLGPGGSGSVRRS